jgi:murein DD-endopeptidase MepM/ murein hydrolase activator NlpD
VGAFFFVPGRSAVLLALASAATAAWCSLSLAVLLGKVGLPLLAWPFVLVSLVSIRALQLRAPDRAPFAAPLAGLSPEANLEYATNRSRRFGLPGPPQLYMPVAGEWCVSQGARGEHTHRGAWEGALDFEVVDENGFPFCGEGRETTDYYAFGKPVYAPGSGTVAAVHDGLSDGRPGDIDSTHPWGNAVVLQHGPELFSVLAHLKCGSIAVKPGAWVTSGQPIAECGSSGRSPRPHLHLQAQRSAELGAPAVPFRLLHFFCLRSKSPRYFSCGLPEEGDHVRAAQPSGVIRSFAILAPGTEWELVRDGTQQSVRIRSEITPLGERFLHELQSGDRLYFVPQDGGVVFTTLLGGESGPLRALFLALPRLPCAEGTHFQFLDEPPQSLFLRGMARWFAEATRLLVDAVATQSTSEVRGTPGAVVIETTAGSGWGRVRRFPFRGRVELDATGIRALEVIDERRPSQPLWRGRRAG